MKNYEAPQLEVLGSVADLTRGEGIHPWDDSVTLDLGFIQIELPAPGTPSS